MPTRTERANADAMMRGFYFREAWRSFMHHRGLAATAIFALTAIQKGMPVKLIALYHPKTPIGIISFPDKPVLALLILVHIVDKSRDMHQAFDEELIQLDVEPVLQHRPRPREARRLGFRRVEGHFGLERGADLN